MSDYEESTETNTKKDTSGKYSGTWPTLLTPYDENLKIDVNSYRKMIEWYLKKNIGGMYANCLSSEMYHLDPDERLMLVSEAVKTVDGHVPVAATGNLGESIEEHIEFCNRVADAGADVVMLLVPTFCYNDADLEQYYLTVEEKVSAPLGLYECPLPRHYLLGIDLVRNLAKTGRFFAFKETSCELSKIRTYLDVLKDTPMSLLQANTPFLLEAVRSGQLGAMSVASIWIPDLIAAVIEGGQTGDPQVEQLNGILCTLEMMQRVVHPKGSKYLLNKRGVPISMMSRSAKTEFSTEVIQAMDCVHNHWFDKDGDLKVLK